MGCVAELDMRLWFLILCASLDALAHTATQRKRDALKVVLRKKGEKKMKN
jgi:hypothetical protein